MNAAVAAANTLPATGGSWSEITKRPFLNDPINRGANFGVGWGYVTGRMTAFTAARRRVYAGSASGGVWRSTDGGAHWTRSTAACRGSRSARWRPTRATARCWVGTGEANNSVREPVRRRRLPARAARARGQRSAGPSSTAPAPTGSSGSAATSTSRPATGCTGARRGARLGGLAAWCCSPIRTRRTRRTGRRRDRRDPGARAERHAGPGRRRLGRLHGAPPRRSEYNGFYVGTGAAGSFHRITPTGDINPTTIGRTTLQQLGRLAVRRRAGHATGDLRGQGAFVSQSGNPAGPWTRIADVDKLADSDSALERRLDRPRTSPASRPTTTSTSWPTRTTARTCTWGSRRSTSPPTAGATWNTVGPYWNFDISLRPGRQHAVQLPADHPPRPARRA